METYSGDIEIEFSLALRRKECLFTLSERTSLALRNLLSAMFN